MALGGGRIRAGAWERVGRLCRLDVGARVAPVAIAAGCVCGVALGQRERVTFEPVASAVLNQSNFVVDSVYFGALDTSALEAEDEARAQDGEMPRFALANAVDYTPERFGSVQLLGDGRIAWRLDIHAEGARSINIGTLFDVPDSMEMYLLNGAGQTLWGAFTSADGAGGQMWSPVVPGEVMRIYAEMDGADWDRFAAGFRVTSVNIGYRGLVGAHGAAERSDSCQIDVACREADPWCEQVKGVVCYTIGGVGTCSGCILNNTAEDGRPLLYTALHCGSQDNPASVRAYFNFQNATCRTPGSAESGGPGSCDDIDFGGIPCDTQTIQGASVVATYQDADAALLELASVPPDSFEVVYEGWSAAATIPDAPPGRAWAVGIHHPGVEEKRISFENDPYIAKKKILIAYVVDCWVLDFDAGGIEPGSSGSPLFDANGRVIGAVTGADQVHRVCDQIQAYGRLEHAWSHSAAFRTALDPVGGGTIEQWDPRAFFPAGAPEAFGFDLAAPADGSATDDTGPDLVWNGACFAETYRVRVSESPDLSDPLVDQYLVAPTTSLDLPDGTLAYGTTYYWRVDAMNGSGTTSSSLFSFTSALAPLPGSPGSFALLAPSAGSMDVERGPLLDWADSANAETYLVEVDDDIAFATPEVSVAVSASGRPSELDLPSGMLEFNTLYAWRVTAMNSVGVSPGSPSVSTFLTETAPPCPCVGDVDGNCKVDVFDLSIFFSHFGTSVPPGTQGDVDGSGFVDVFDFGVFVQDLGCAA